MSMLLSDLLLFLCLTAWATNGDCDCEPAHLTEHHGHCARSVTFSLEIAPDIDDFEQWKACVVGFYERYLGMP